jgi:hypothetical protein
MRITCSSANRFFMSSPRFQVTSELILHLATRNVSGQSKRCLGQALKPHIHADAILCTDSSAAMAAAANDLRVQHEALNLSAGERVRGPWHIQNANAYHGRLKGWIARCKGVATDYLESYLGWFRALDRASSNRRKSAPMLALALGIEHH